MATTFLRNIVILTDVVYIHVNCGLNFGVKNYMYVISFELFLPRDNCIEKYEMIWYTFLFKKLRDVTQGAIVG